MSAVKDHPDIEKLPLEVDGIPVRETISEIFRNPENGTPDNISKAGCLALALKSNEVGGEVKGHVVWNAWREVFSTVRTGWRVYDNQVDLQGVDFREGTINFSGFKFGDGAKFNKAQWGDRANFQGAQWGDDADFQGAQWGHLANLQGVEWGNNVMFIGAQWGILARFRCAKWGENSHFQGAKWGGNADFRGALFASDANFEGAQWGGQALFEGAVFGQGANFRASSWDKQRQYYQDEDAWGRAKIWADERGIRPDAFDTIDFSGATFLGEVDFSGRRFLGRTCFGPLSNNFRYQQVKRDYGGRAVFDGKNELVWEVNAAPEGMYSHPGHVRFNKAPIFHGCELHQDTSFEDAKFPDPTGSEEAARAYRTLKLAFSKQQAIREEQRFFRYEMAEEAMQKTGFERRLFWLYKTFSDYGFSITRPLKYGGLGVLALTLVYGLLSWVGQCVFSDGAGCQFAPQWIEFTLLQTLPLPGLDKLSDTAKAAFWPSGAWWSFGLSFLVIIHKTLSLAALFLVGLALRNLFKLK